MARPGQPGTPGKGPSRRQVYQSAADSDAFNINGALSALGLQEWTQQEEPMQDLVCHSTVMAVSLIEDPLRTPLGPPPAHG
eukprot:1746425-Pyramimonas_sp.AAC.1